MTRRKQVPLCFPHTTVRQDSDRKSALGTESGPSPRGTSLAPHSNTQPSAPAVMFRPVLLIAGVFASLYKRDSKKRGVVPNP